MAADQLRCSFGFLRFVVGERSDVSEERITHT